MLNTGTNVLKSGDVKVEGEFRLDIDMPVQPSAAVGPQTAPTAAPQVVIVENNPEYAVIELTCACGVKSRIQCRYDQPRNGANQTK